jgi:hypothetical protein
LATALLGDQESIESVLLADVFSSGGSRNTYIDKNGRVGQILGYTKQNAAAIVSNTGGVAMRLRGLFHYLNQSGGSPTRQEVGIFTDDNLHWEFRTSVDIGVTWVFVADLGAGSANRIPSFAGAGDLLFLANGVVAPRQWDGTTLTTAGSVQLAAPTYVDVGVGTLTGNISWRVLPVVGTTRKLGSVQSLNTALAGRTGTLSWVADPDVTVTGYEIYRTTGTGATFYFEGSVVGRTTVTFTVGAAADTDAALISQRVMQEFGDPPPVGAYFVFPHKERMFYLRTDANPRQVFYSDPGVPYSCNVAFNKVDFTDSKSFSDVATGGIGDFLGMGVVFQERSIWVLSGTGEIIGTVRDFVRRRTNAQAGTVSYRTIARMPAGSAYTDSEGNTVRTSQVTLAYLSPFADIRLFDGDNDIIISFPKRLTLQLLNYAQRGKSFCVPDTQRQEVTWVFPSGASTEPSQAVTWNYRWGTWYSRDWPFAHAIEIETPNTASMLLAGEPLLATGGFCYRLWNGYTFNGALIQSQWETKTLFGQGFFGDPIGLYGKPLISFRKRWRWTDALFDVIGGTVTLTVEWIAGDDPGDSAAALGSRTVVMPVSRLQTSDGHPILTSDQSPLQVASLPSLIRAKLQTVDGRYIHARGLRLRYKLSTSSAQWFLSTLDNAYQLLPGLKRSVQGMS